MTITVKVFGAEEVERSLKILSRRFPKSAQQASSTAATRARAEFNRQAVRTTTIRLTRLTNRRDGLVGRVFKTSKGGGGHAFRISAKRPGVESFKNTKFRKRHGLSYQDYVGSTRKTVTHAFKQKFNPKRGVFARIMFRAGLRASKKGRAPKPGPSGLVHRLPTMRFRGLSMSRLWDNKPKVRNAVTRFGQDALATEVNIRLARLIARGKL